MEKKFVKGKERKWGDIKDLLTHKRVRKLQSFSSTAGTTTKPSKRHVWHWQTENSIIKLASKTM